MNDLFYHQATKVLFWVAGYCGNSNNVQEIINEYKKDAKKLADLAGVTFETIKTAEIPKSSRYKYMRVYYIEDFDGAKIQDKDKYYKKIDNQSVFMLTKENFKSMWEWLEN